MSSPSTAEPTPDVHIAYWLTQELRDDFVEGALEYLSADERARCARFRFADDRRDYAAAHVLLRRMLSTYDGRPERDWAFVSGPHGKPALAPGTADRPGLSFNLAHAKGMVACVVARDVEVGIDVEPTHRSGDLLSIARHYFSPAEVSALEQCDDRQTRFVELWTLKESYLKATGDGLAGGLDRFGFDLDDSTRLLFQPPDAGNGLAWKFALLDVDHYRLAVATAAGETPRTATFLVHEYDGDLFQMAARAHVLRTSSAFVRHDADHARA